MVGKYHNDIEAYFAINSCEGNTLDCRYHNEHFICSKSIENCISSLIEFLNKLPKEIKPAWYSENVIDSYRTLIKQANKLWK